MNDIIFGVHSPLSNTLRGGYHILKLRAVLFSVLSSTFLFVSIGFGQSSSTVATVDLSKRNDIPATSPKKVVRVEDVELDLAEALAVIEGNHFNGASLDYNDLFKTSIDTMLHTLDPHSNYFDAKEAEEFRTEQTSRYYGIGALIGDLSDADDKLLGTYIKSTFNGAPANRAGLRYGDKIVEVNGTSMLGKPYAEVRNFLRGPKGTPAKIVVERLGTGQKETVEIIRDSVSQPSISEIYMIRPGVGYIAMRDAFNSTTAFEFGEAMRKLKAEGMQQLVFDIRNNRGGLVSQALKIASTFLSEGQIILTQKGRLQGEIDPYSSDNKKPDRIPIVVLVNRYSASASEIVAGALQDHDRALIVGENTFGKGLVQNPFSLDYGSMLLLTIAKYETPSGRQIQRDYSNGELYNYLTDGGTFKNENSAPTVPSGPESRTDGGRPVYSGGGINPDVAIKPQTIPAERVRIQNKMVNPLLAFSLEVVGGRVKGFETYKVDKPITFGYDIKKSDFPVTEPLFAAYKKFAAEKYNIAAALTDSEREFVTRMLRTEFVTAAYGNETSQQVFNEYDTTLSKGIELLPQAKSLVLESLKSKTSASRQSVPNEK